MLSSSETGRRREIDWVVGLRLGSVTRFACGQSTYSIESCRSQNVLSSASEENAGTSLRFLFIDHTLLSVQLDNSTTLFPRIFYSPLTTVSAEEAESITSLTTWANAIACGAFTLSLCRTRLIVAIPSRCGKSHI